MTNKKDLFDAIHELAKVLPRKIIFPANEKTIIIFDDSPLGRTCYDVQFSFSQDAADAILAALPTPMFWQCTSNGKKVGYDMVTVESWTGEIFADVEGNGEYGLIRTVYNCESKQDIAIFATTYGIEHFLTYLLEDEEIDKQEETIKRTDTDNLWLHRNYLMMISTLCKMIVINPKKLAEDIDLFLKKNKPEDAEKQMSIAEHNQNFKNIKKLDAEIAAQKKLLEIIRKGK